MFAPEDELEWPVDPVPLLDDDAFSDPFDGCDDPFSDPFAGVLVIDAADLLASGAGAGLDELAMLRAVRDAEPGHGRCWRCPRCRPPSCLL